MDYTIENICIYGTGGVGGYIGGVIAHHLAESGDTKRRVYFIARGKHLEAIRKNGLVIESGTRGRLVCTPALATDDMSAVPPPDLCLLCVKGYDLPEALAAVKGNIKENTVIMPLLNGADIFERVRGVISGGIVLPSCVYVVAHIEAPGVVRQSGGGLIISGNAPGERTIDPAGLKSLFRETGIPFQWHDDPRNAIWKKYILIASFALVSSYKDMSMGAILKDAEAAGLVRSIMEEIAAIAALKGTDLGSDIIASTLETVGRLPADARTSFQRDVAEKGARNEGDLFGGTVIRYGRELGVPTPVTQSVYGEILRRIKD